MATVPVAHTFASGDTLRATDMQTYVSNAFTFLESRPHCLIYNSNTQSVTQNLATFLTYNALRFDNDNLFTVNAPDRITIQTAGLYQVGAAGIWQATTPVGELGGVLSKGRQVALLPQFVVSTTIKAFTSDHRGVGSDDASEDFAMHGMAFFPSVGDIMQTYAYQSSNSVLTVGSLELWACWMST